ncbi:hypothetical protein [Metabacillus schmidteae]|uniref:hypothetical protein n=1 Tax=Metabacillus schmidteae TaxID=2730405 RepID=UPI001589D211|nr:hypothetical protein [Metabacillus schmidteae]
MNKYFKLVHFEFNRFSNIFFILIGITIVSQIISVFTSANNYLSNLNHMVYREGMSKEQFIEQYDYMSLQQVTASVWFVGPIAVCIVTLLIYLFFIWYRDWLGKNSFIYRLLMLPTSRVNLYMAKVTTIMLLVFGLVGLQLILLPIENILLEIMIPSEYILNLPVYETFSYRYGFLNTLFPMKFMQFLIYYGVGLMAVLVLFTAILFERCFRWKGIALGIIYCIVSALVFTSPLIVQSTFLDDFFYPIEQLGLIVITGLIVTAASILVSLYLLKNKITV